MENNVITKNVKIIDFDLLDFFIDFSFSKSFTLYASNDFINYQEYRKINEQHLYIISDFLKNELYINKSIELVINNKFSTKIIYNFD